VDGKVGDVKTKYSQSGLPLDPALAEILFTWKRASELNGKETGCLPAERRRPKLHYDRRQFSKIT